MGERAYPEIYRRQWYSWIWSSNGRHATAMCRACSRLPWLFYVHVRGGTMRARCKVTDSNSLKQTTTLVFIRSCYPWTLLVMPVVENRRQHRRRIIWVRLFDSETVNEPAVLIYREQLSKDFHWSMVSFLKNKHPGETLPVKLINLDTTSRISTCRATVHIEARLPCLLDLVARSRLLRLLSTTAIDISVTVPRWQSHFGMGLTYRSKSLA